MMTHWFIMVIKRVNVELDTILNVHYIFKNEMFLSICSRRILDSVPAYKRLFCLNNVHSPELSPE